jgi:hypothetical protein
VVNYLAGGLEHVLFSIIYGIILPSDQYFSEGLKPPTRLYVSMLFVFKKSYNSIGGMHLFQGKLLYLFL